jgi:hypothetical protein
MSLQRAATASASQQASLYWTTKGEQVADLAINRFRIKDAAQLPHI